MHVYLCVKSSQPYDHLNLSPQHVQYELGGPGFLRRTGAIPIGCIDAVGVRLEGGKGGWAG